MDLKFNEQHHYRYDEALHVTPNSELYKALDLTYDRTVALKKVVVSGNSKREIAENYKRAAQEVRTMIRVSELTAKIPNIYGMYYNEEQNELFIVMQWVGGETLAEKMEQNLSMAVYLRWIRELCGILKAMSSRHFQHKDIKPENIMFNENDDLYLIDFNLSVSVPNQIEGTPFYKAPEMDFGSTTVSRDKADMFSIGVILYQMATGKLPMRISDYEIYDPDAVKWDFFTAPHEITPDIDPKLEEIIMRLMAYLPEDRYRNYNALAGDLRTVEQNLRARKKKNGR